MVDFRYRTKSGDLITKYQSFDAIGENENTAQVSKVRRYFYDDFTSLDWTQDYLKDISYRQQIRSLSGVVGQLKRCIDSLKDWILITFIAFSCSLIAYTIAIFEGLLIDLKRGYCASNIFNNEKRCCGGYGCTSWVLWTDFFDGGRIWRFEAEFVIYLSLSLIFAYLAVLITLTTKSENPLASKTNRLQKTTYAAYGSGVPEVKTILSGFTIRKFLGSYTLLTKSSALVFAIASGMSLGKEGPYVHLTTCVGNISSRIFKKFRDNGVERRIILSAAAAAGVTLAFGSPLGGVLFSLEEVSYYLPGNQLFKSFFCAIMSHLFMILLNPYETGKSVLFEVSYDSDWQYLEVILHIMIGIVGGIFGALFCKFVNFWADWFRNSKYMKSHPIREVLLISLVTALLTFGNKYTSVAVPELLAELSSPCYLPNDSTGIAGLCPDDTSKFPAELWPLLYALVVKIVLTAVTFGLKVPAGIYVPSMVIGALFGRIFAMYFQYLGSVQKLPIVVQIISPKGKDGTFIDFGIYAMISAGAFMAGVTRMNITLATIMAELTSSYNYVVPFSIAIAVSVFVANAIEPKSLYEVLIQKNDFPYLNNRKAHNFSGIETQLSEIITRFDHPAFRASKMYINVTNDKYVSITELRSILTYVQNEGLVDWSIPILKDGKLVSILPSPELEPKLDTITHFIKEYHIITDIKIKLSDIQDITFKLIDTKGDNSSIDQSYLGDTGPNKRILGSTESEEIIFRTLNTLCDLRDIMEISPITLDIKAPLSLVEYIFTRLGNRVISITDNGDFVGILHKKRFIDQYRNRTML
ncbi:chloride channel protein Ecym_1015 [Eremothecium cymbalariae DBVPG|uniref:Chloride channel protein n=1 Tax=Eremothecium cymbalariae (strain CBS 270.75 / DBVPG 7215 / KCTC 17166 / NRRL Y-17582) TaxID=931890 RepID=G8JM14_ERECY|nr:hypothetical protein Ecym_1015 [Eremothecium cymbalariae DBVPG\